MALFPKNEISKWNADGSFDNVGSYIEHFGNFMPNYKFSVFLYSPDYTQVFFSDSVSINTKEKYIIADIRHKLLEVQNTKDVILVIRDETLYRTNLKRYPNVFIEHESFKERLQLEFNHLGRTELILPYTGKRILIYIN